MKNVNETKDNKNGHGRAIICRLKTNKNPNDILVNKNNKE